LLDDDAAPDDASSLMRAALRGARADVPDAAHVEALSRSIAGAIGGGSGGDPSGGAGAGTGAVGATKVAIGTLALLAAVWGIVLVTRGGGPSSDTRANADTSASGVAAVTASASPAETVFDVHALPAAPGVDAARPGGSATAREVGSPEAEMTLLRSAQDALGRAPSEALARCDEHARGYPRGALAEEREIIAVDALVRLGRRDDADARASRFRAAHPGSAYLRRLDTLLGPAP
jgi:hypothetical protein